MVMVMSASNQSGTLRLSGTLMLTTPSPALTLMPCDLMENSLLAPKVLLSWVSRGAVITLAGKSCDWQSEVLTVIACEPRVRDTLGALLIAATRAMVVG